MPLYKAIQQQETARSAIWKIEEPETFFSERLGFSSLQKLEKRRLEHLASRFLLQYLMPEFPFSRVNTTLPGKPFLPDSDLHFSISHSFPYVAAAISEKPVGIDVQTFREKIIQLKHKFLGPKEQALFGNNIERLTLAWTAKEAAYKWFGDGGMDFIRHLPICGLKCHQNHDFFLEIELLRTGQPLLLTLNGAIEQDFAWSVTER